MNKQQLRSIRAFVGAKDFQLSRSFYLELGFAESVISPTFSLFTKDALSFYLQDYYVKDWIDNTMLLLEVVHLQDFWDYLRSLELDKKYAGVKLIPIQQHDWGSECLLIDPSGVLWHFATFN